MLLLLPLLLYLRIIEHVVRVAGLCGGRKSMRSREHWHSRTSGHRPAGFYEDAGLGREEGQWEQRQRSTCAARPARILIFTSS
ncbi:hypothetical protein BDY17DRAFT_291751 [Neohortaea acidophila]|uniref:Secreted protein n=1 Tax=Neohortaea acidophila TaxID=245834 RepID=A0A6A6Q4K8_9PEZI|nr:uncharacterized protein BDY17DRAFT_291751 [Neohortaea acidophila]KAF2486593.1 hypothetical protein BDY17DRAFT_291751 [Neohortaea acidophila]